jgi:hypothetical protein
MIGAPRRTGELSWHAWTLETIWSGRRCAALWGVFTPLLKAIEMLNERRDKIVDPNSNLTPRHRYLMLYSDWLAIYVASYAFLVVVGLLVFNSPSFFDADAAAEGIKRNGNLIFQVVGCAILAFGVIGLFTGVADFRAMRRAINEIEVKSKRSSE